jgi:hypothetical protein
MEMTMKKITLSALVLGAALAIAGSAQAEKTFAPIETGAGKLKASAFVAGSNGGKAGYSGGSAHLISRR